MKLKQFKGIESFLFDLGGVIIDIDPQKTISSFKKLGFTAVEEQVTQSHHVGLFKQLERGDIDEQTFINNIKQHVEKTVSAAMIKRAWNDILVSFPVERVQILEQLKRHFPVYLLSNTNGIHQRCFNRMAEGHASMEELFTDVFYSYQLGCSKPEALAFEKVIEDTGLNPSSTLFLDDSPINLEAAKKLGFQTLLISRDFTMQDAFIQK